MDAHLFGSPGKEQTNGVIVHYSSLVGSMNLKSFGWIIVRDHNHARELD